MSTPISPADQALIDKWLARKRVATVPVCPCCNRECEVVTQDEGGMEEVWGAMSWCEHLVDVSGCCNEPVKMMTPEEFEALEQTV